MILLIVTIAFLIFLFTSNLCPWAYQGWKWKTAPKSEKTYMIGFLFVSGVILAFEILLILSIQKIE